MPSANRLIFSEAAGSSEVVTVGETPSRSSMIGGDRLGVLLIDGDGQAGRPGIPLAQVHQLRVGLREHGGHPVAGDVEGRAQPLAGQLARQTIVEGRLVRDAVGRGPLHPPVDARKIDRPHDLAVLQRVAVSVLEVGLGQLADVVDEGDRPLVRAKRRARQAEPPPGRVERLADRVAPRPAVARRGGSRPAPPAPVAPSAGTPPAPPATC